MKTLEQAILVALGTLSVLFPWSASSADLITATPSHEDTRITLQFRSRPVMVYEFSPSKYKPYVKELCTTKGKNVLLDAPPDHLHHHSLMYGIKVNGVNFWEETSGSGVQRVVRTEPVDSSPGRSSLPQAVLRQELLWVPAADAFLPLSNSPALLVEHRTLTLNVDEARQEVALLWHSRFRVGTSTNTVVLTGSTYHGLGIRFLRELDPVAVHFTAEGRPDLGENRQETKVYPWEAVAFDAPGNPVTFAVFGSSKNARGNPHFFSMRTPFAYLSATQGLDQEPLVYRSGDQFEISYLITLYPATKGVEALTARARLFESQNH